METSFKAFPDFRTKAAITVMRSRSPMTVSTIPRGSGLPYPGQWKASESDGHLSFVHRTYNSLLVIVNIFVL